MWFDVISLSFGIIFPKVKGNRMRLFMYTVYLVFMAGIYIHLYTFAKRCKIVKSCCIFRFKEFIRLIYSQFRKTLPKSGLELHWTSVRFYEMGVT